MTHLRSDPSVTPAALAQILPSRPVYTASPARHRDMIAQFYRHPPGGVEYPCLPAHGLVISMGGESLVTDKTAHGQRQAWNRPGCITLTPAGQSVQRSWQGRPESIVALLDPALTASIAEELDWHGAKCELTPQLGVHDPILHDLGRVLLAAMTDASPATALMFDALSRAIGVHLLRHYNEIATTPDRVQPSLSPVRFRRVVDFMKANIDRPISLGDLAQICGLSKTHLGRAFNRASGESPHRYLNALRIEKAKELLETSQMPMALIADACGFGQAQYFATVFRREIGITPSVWRRERGRAAP